MIFMDEYYKTRYIFNSKRAIVWKEIVRYLNRFISEESAVLDLGAGYCDFINNVKAKFKYAVDISPDFKKFANPDIKTFISPAWNLNFIQDESIGIVHASNLLEHLDDEELRKTMAEIKRVLKKEGILILLQPNFRYAENKYFKDPTHKKIFSDDTLGEFLKNNNFKIIHKKPKFLPFSLESKPSFIPIFPLIVRAYIYSPLKPFAGQMLFVAQKND